MFLLPLSIRVYTNALGQARPRPPQSTRAQTRRHTQTHALWRLHICAPFEREYRVSSVRATCVFATSQRGNINHEQLSHSMFFKNIARFASIQGKHVSVATEHTEGKLFEVYF